MILVTGATGNVGRPLVQLLDDLGEPVRVVTRGADPGAFPPRVDVVVADPSRPSTTDGAFDAVTTVFLNPRAVGGRAAELLTLAAARGVTRVVVLSAINVDDDPGRQPSRFRGDLNREVEAAAVASGLAWVAVRPSVFAGNTVGLWAAMIRRGDVVSGPHGDAAAAPVDEVDVAAVAARALVGAVPSGSRLDLTGPWSLTQREMVAAIGRALDRPLRYQEVPPGMAREAMTGQGFPPGFADAYLAMQAAAVGQPARTTGTVATILGRPATPFASWASAHADEFRTAAGARR